MFTQAIVELPGAPFWSCIFFLMLLALGLGSQIGILEGMLCVIFDIDLFKRIKKQYMTGRMIHRVLFLFLLLIESYIYIKKKKKGRDSNFKKISMVLNDPFFLRGSLHGVLLCWFNILYRSRRILAKDVRQFRRYHRPRDGRAHGNDFRHLCLWPRKVRSKFYYISR